MLKELLTSSAIVLALAGPAFAGSTEPSAAEQAEAAQSEDPAVEQSEVPSATANPPAAAAMDDPNTSDASGTSGTSSNGDVIAVQSEDEKRMTNLIGMPVTNPQGEEVGNVHDALFTKDGKISGVVLSVGGFLGIGDKLVALPWEAVEVNYAEDSVLVDATRDQLGAAPPFKTWEQVVAEEEATKAVETQQQQMQQNPPSDEQEQQQ